jgi:alkylation response protein AidB-like acyl-CoA dehydrogenase
VTSPPSAEQLQAEVRAFVDAEWDPDLALVEWRRKLVAAGLAAPSWPSRWGGRGLPAWTDEVVQRALVDAGAVGTPIGSGMLLAAPTLLEQGPDEVRDRYLVPTLTGEVTWCQLFSEPGAGSDLAGLTARADRDGDEWIVSGQKVWNTSAHHADVGMLVARTDWTVPKHQGITYFVLPMRQPGVEVRPLHQMNGHASFNEVFLTEARIPADHVVGQVGEGWRAAQTTLAHERRFGAFGATGYAPGEGRARAEARAEVEAHLATYRWYPQRMGRVDLLAPEAHRTGAATDPAARQQIAAVASQQRIAGWTAQRALAARRLGRPPGPEGSIGKLTASHVARGAAAAHSRIAGAEGMLTGPGSPAEGMVAEVLVSVPAQSIAGGTDEIQRNILGERILGLPREPDASKDRPFQDVPRNT